MNQHVNEIKYLKLLKYMHNKNDSFLNDEQVPLNNTKGCAIFLPN